MLVSIKRKNITAFLKVALFILIGTVIMGCYIFFWGPPFGDLYANKEISKYINTVYGNEVKINITSYNLVTHSYEATVNKNSTDENNIRYDIYNRQMHDAALSTQMEIKFNRDYLAAIKSFPQNFTFPTGAFIYTAVDATGGYNTDTEKMKYVHKLYLLNVVNMDPNVTENSSKKELAKIVQTLLDKLSPKYKFFGMQVNYVDATGVYTIAYNSSNVEELYSDTEKYIFKSELKDIALNSQELIDSIRSKKK